MTSRSQRPAWGDGPRGHRLATLKHRARRTVPPAVKPALRSLLDVADPAVVAGYRLRSGDRAPMPRRSLRARIGEPDPERFTVVGRDVADILDRAGAKHGLTPGRAATVLDFGCGCGRIARVILERRMGPGFAGCDVDAQAIRWLRRHFGDQARFEVNDFRPPLPFGDGEFELVYSISIFSHLSGEMQELWLEELKRVVRPGGVCLLSTHGEHAYEHARNAFMPGMSDDLRARLLSHGALRDEGLVFEPYAVAVRDGRELPGIEGGDYGLTFQSEQAIRTRWGAVFEVLDVHPRLVRGWQDLVALRRT